MFTIYIYCTHEILSLISLDVSYGLSGHTSTFVDHDYEDHTPPDDKQEPHSTHATSDCVISITQVLDSYIADYLHGKRNYITQSAIKKKPPAIEYPNLVLDRELEQPSKFLY